MKLHEQFEFVAAEMEALDEEFRTNGIPDAYRELWGVSNNVGIWSVPRSTAELLHQLVLMKQPKLILELGTSIGYSTIWLAAAAERVGAEVATIEIEAFKVETAEQFIARAGVAKQVRQIQGDIGEVLDGWDEPIDFVFMDANKRGYLSYIKQIEPHLAPGAVVVADNTMDMRDKMEDFLEYIRESKHFRSSELPLDHGLLVAVRV